MPDFQAVFIRECRVNKLKTGGRVVVVLLSLAANAIPARAETQSQAPTATTVTILGQVEQVDAPNRTLKMKAADGTLLTVSLAERGNVVKVAPGETSLQNAAPISFDAIVAGDRVMVRGGEKAGDAITKALRVVVMAQTDLAARNEAEQRAWRERGVAGTIISADSVNEEFILKVNTPTTPSAAAPGSSAPATNIVVSAKGATIHRYADTSVKFTDARKATVAEMAAADQARVLGTRSPDGAKITAERVVFGSFTTMALAIEKIDPVAGQISVKDLQSNQKFTIAMVPGGTIRKIPAEMGAMFAAMSGGTGGGRPGMGGGMGAGAPASGNPAGTRPEGARGGSSSTPGAPAMGAGAPGGMGARPTGGGRGRGGMEDMVDRMPVITLADLKKDDWIGAVVGKIDASGKAVAFNMLAGIEVFAARANRGGGVDVGMPAGLLDGAMGVP